MASPITPVRRDERGFPSKSRDVFVNHRLNPVRPPLMSSSSPVMSRPRDAKNTTRGRSFGAEAATGICLTLLALLLGQGSYHLFFT